MEKQIITFSANEQKLIKTGGIECYASNIVSYIEAHFDLGANWSGYDSVRAVWSNDNNMTVISTVLDSNGVCVVPFEVLKTKGIVKVNLVGSISVSDVLTDRLTSFPCEAVKVTAKAKIEGSETQPITPSQFEQFVAAVISEVEKVTGMTAQAETLPAGSQATARYENGILYLGIPQGIQGERGETGADGNGIASVVYNADYTLTLVFDNGERFTTPPIRGERGPAGADGRDGTDGRDGADGVTPSLSVGTVTTLPSTEDAYVTRTGTDENPVFNFGIPQGPKGDPGEVTMSQLSALLPTDTASGDIASFSDGTDLFPALSVKAQIEPIQSGSGTPSPDNIRPISGHDEVNVSVCGVNVWGGLKMAEDIHDVVPSSTLDTTAKTIKYEASAINGKVLYDRFSPNTQYTIILHGDNTSSTKATNMLVKYTDGSYTYLPNFVNGVSVFTTDSAKSVLNIQGNWGTSQTTLYYEQCGIFEGVLTADDFEPYQGNTYTTTLGRTVYGGEAEIVGGVLTDKMGVVDLGSLNWTLHSAGFMQSNGITSLVKKPSTSSDVANVVCSALETVSAYSIYNGGNGVGIHSDGNIRVRYDNMPTETTAFKTAMSGVQLCYELATPQTYQLDPTEVDLLLGQNNLWTDCGSVEVTYKADVGLYIDKKLGTSGTRLLSMGLTKSATAEAEAETETEEAKAETDKTEKR